jgi:hypothetical protein
MSIKRIILKPFTSIYSSLSFVFNLITFSLSFIGNCIKYYTYNIFNELINLSKHILYKTLILTLAMAIIGVLTPSFISITTISNYIIFGILGLTLSVSLPNKEFKKFKEKLNHNVSSYFILYGLAASLSLSIGKYLIPAAKALTWFALPGSLMIAYSMYLFTSLFYQSSKLTYYWLKNTFNYDLDRSKEDKFMPVVLFSSLSYEFVTIVLSVIQIYYPPLKSLTSVVKLRSFCSTVKAAEFIAIGSRFVDSTGYSSPKGAQKNVLDSIGHLSSSLSELSSDCKKIYNNESMKLSSNTFK